MMYSTPEGKEMIIDWLEDKLEFIESRGIAEIRLSQKDIADILEALKGDS